MLSHGNRAAKEVKQLFEEKTSLVHKKTTLELACFFE